MVKWTTLARRETQGVMLSRVHRTLVSRTAAALVAVALSGLGAAAAQLPRSPGAHTCRCPKGDHDCTCPVCRAAIVAARARTAGAPPCHGAAAGSEPRRADEPCRVASACHVPEALISPEGREAFTLGDPPAAAGAAVEELALRSPATPPEISQPPEVPPPRPALRS